MNDQLGYYQQAKQQVSRQEAKPIDATRSRTNVSN